MSLERLRIFVSSPGDVSEERVLARRVIQRLADEMAERVAMEPVFWEHEPLLATDSFQAQITHPSETDIVICILWSRIGTRLPSDIVRPDGSRYASGTEYEFEDAVAGRKRKGAPDLLVYRKIAEPVVSLSDKHALLQRLDQKDALDLFCEKWFKDPQEGTLISAFHPFLSSAEFEERLEDHLRLLILKRFPEQRPAEAPPKATWTHGSPFRGLEVFEFEHAAVFFGRAKAVSEVLNALRKNAAGGRAFALVLGPSGGGKSSLVRAGVLPLLTQPGVIEGVGLWRRAVLRPGDSPADLFLGLARALLTPEALPELSADGTTAAQLARTLRDTPGAASALLKGGLSQAASVLAMRDRLAKQPEARLALVIDQLEELFTLEPVTPADRAAFIDAVSALARSQRVYVIATLRSDFYSRCGDLPELVALKEGAGQYDLLLPTASEISQLIRQPAFAAGLRFEEDTESKARLDDVLRDAAAGHPESLPLLEFALEELYKQRTPGGVLTHTAYHQLGGVEGALARRAEAVFASLPAEVQATLGRVFRALVNVGESEAVARRQAPRAAAAATPQAEALVEALVRSRLLVAGSAPDGSAVVGVAHEALLRNWPRLQNWLAQDRELLVVRSRISAAASRWQAEGRRSDLLLGEGKPLDEGRMLLRSFGPDVSASDAEFVQASLRLARSRRRLKRGAVAALVLLALAATTGGAIANRARREADRQKRAAQEQKAEAERQKSIAERSSDVANSQRQLALGTVGDLIFQVQEDLDKPGLLAARKSILDLALDRLTQIDRGSAAAGVGADRSAATADGELGEIFMLLGQTARAKDAYQRANQLFTRLAAADPANAGARRDLSVSYEQLGEVSQRLGDTAAAKSLYAKSLDLRKALAAADPANALAQRDLLVSCDRLGNISLQSGDVAAAKGFYSQSLDVRRALAAAHPSDAQAQRDLSITCTKLGDVTLQLGDVTAAKGFYDESLDRSKAQVAANPTDARAKHDLSAAYLNVGDVCLQLGEVAAAREHYEKCSTLAVAMAAADPDNAMAKRDLAISYGKLGDASLQLGDAAGAKGYYVQALDITKALAAADSANALAQSDLSIAYNKLGSVSLQLGDATAAKAFYSHSLEVGKALVAADPANAEAKRNLSITCNNLGDTSLQLSDAAGAVAFYKQALDIAAALSAANPASADAKRDLATSYVKLGNASLKSGDRAAARTFFKKDLEITQALAAADPGNAQARRDLSISYDSMGDVTLAQGDAAAARGFYAQSLDVRKALAAAQSANVQAQRDLAISYRKMGNVSLRMYDASGARGFYNQCLDIASAQAASDPTNLQAQTDLVFGHFNVGTALQSEKKLPEAAEAYSKALQLLRSLQAAGKLKDQPNYERFATAIEKLIADCRKAETQPATMPATAPAGTIGRGAGPP